jgi:hypothetical protein
MKRNLDMKRLLPVVGVLSLCLAIAGCTGDTREGLIDDTIGMMNQAATEMGNVQKRVSEAVKNYEDGKAIKLDLADAIKATDKLKETGVKTLEIKARIDIAKSQITDEERKTYAENKQQSLNAAFKNLQTEQDKLRKALVTAEKCGAPNAALAVEELRKKIVEAESPYEAIAR